MKLIDLHPEFLDAGGAGVFNADGTPATPRQGVGIQFDCPCGCGQPCYVPFTTPLDGGPPLERKGWARGGDTFETLTLRPSILRVKWRDAAGVEHGCGWHGWITRGEVTSC